MFELWVPITVAGAFLQNLRSAIQKHLTGQLSGQGAAYSRFLFALPWALVYLALVVSVTDKPLPTPNPRFWVFVSIGGVCQIMATVTLLKSFSFRSFAVGTTVSKLEIIIVALLGVVLLGDHLSAIGYVAIGLSTLGLLVLSAARNNLTLRSLFSGLREPATVYGLLAAFFLGASVILFRGASLSLQEPNLFLAAAFTLLTALLIQTVLMAVYLLLAEPGELTRVLRSWRLSALVGIAGMLASACWLTAFTMQNASYVRALGQIELLFTFFATTRVFREQINKLEYVGAALIIGGIVLLLLYA